MNISISLSGQAYQQFYKLYNFSGNNMIPIFSSYYNISWSGTVNLSNSESSMNGVGIGFVKVRPVNQYSSNGVNGIVSINVPSSGSLNYTYPQSQYSNDFSNIYNVLYNQSMCLNGDYQYTTGNFNIPLGITNENVLQVTTNDDLTGTLNINIFYSMYAIVLIK